MLPVFLISYLLAYHFMENPFFSIIIPTLNEEHFVPNLLQDLEKQKEKNFEVIVVDSSSHDKTRETVLRFTKLQLRFFENERKNVSIQRNFGVRHSRGSYLIFLDADTRVNPTFTRKLEKTIVKRKGLFFIPKIQSDDPETESKIVIDIINFFFELSQNFNRPFALGAGMIFERNYFITLGGFDEKLSMGEDYDLAIRSFSWGVRAKFLKDIFITYSLRRIRREGKLKSYYKFFLSNVQYLIRGKIEKGLIEYEMGGHLYNKTHLKKSENNFQDILNRVKKILISLLKE